MCIHIICIISENVYAYVYSHMCIYSYIHIHTKYVIYNIYTYMERDVQYINIHVYVFGHIWYFCVKYIYIYVCLSTSIYTYNIIYIYAYVCICSLLLQLPVPACAVVHICAAQAWGGYHKQWRAVKRLRPCMDLSNRELIARAI